MAGAQSDDVVWAVIGAGEGSFCSYKIKAPSTKTHMTFCRQPMNLSGQCNRQSCPLANAKYATVREIDGAIFLFVKTAERAHSPARQWEKIKLSNNYEKALAQIDQELPYWSNFITHKAKQRLTKITQYLIKMRRIKLKEEEQPKLVGIKKKTERREATREAKALRAAKLEKSIEAELLARLKSGAYGDAPLNVNEDVWNAILEGKAQAEGIELEDEESDEEDEEDLLEEEFEDEEGVGDREFVSDDESESDLEGDFSDDESLGLASDSDAESGESDEEEGSEAGDDGDEAGRKRKAAPPAGPSKRGKTDKAKPKKGKKGGARLEVEYEEETAPLTREQLASW